MSDEDLVMWCKTHRARATSSVSCDRYSPGEEDEETLELVRLVGVSAAAKKLGVSRQTVYNRVHSTISDCDPVKVQIVVVDET